VHGDVRFPSVFELKSGVSHFSHFLGRQQAHSID
jgi:hypothetical protein